MQYFRNMPRRPMDPGVRGSDMFPLCRSDCMPKPDLSRERQNGCGECEKTKINEPEHHKSPCVCGCERDSRSVENECGACRESRENNNAGCPSMCRCENTARAEDYGCTGLSIAFVPEQEFDELNDAEEALCRGTLFRKLDMPFYGQKRRSCK